MKIFLSLLLASLFIFCKSETQRQTVPQNPTNDKIETARFALQKVLNPEGQTIQERFNPPIGFERVEVVKNTYQEYLRNLPLMPDGSPVLLFNGDKKYRQNVHDAVIDIDVGKRDLQQCADAVMRLRSEYLFSQKDYDKIHFNFTNGFNAEYKRWRKGNRISVIGNKVSWVENSSESTSYNSFRKYLDMVFSYAGTWSLEKELLPVEIKEMQIGDVFIQGGSPGHAITIIDMAEDKSTGKKLFMVAQSYMPAQHIHVLKNLNDPSISPWYSLDFGDKLNTPEWDFMNSDLKRFDEH